MEELFRSYTDKKKPASGWLIKLAIGVIAVACMVAAGFLLAPGPYDDVVSGLRSGMTELEVVQELGLAHFDKTVTIRIDGYGEHHELLYRAEGLEPLALQFLQDRYDYSHREPGLAKWCYKSRCHEVKHAD